MRKQSKTDQHISPRMIRAARGLVGLDQTQLAELVGVHRRTIIRIEADPDSMMNSRRLAIHDRIQVTLEEEHGVEFIFSTGAHGEGVRLNKPMK